MDNKKERILFVDDEELILETYSEYFQRKGYQVFAAINGLEAMRIIRHENIDCCFTDINMPKMDGFELAEYIKKFDNSIPVVIMTAYPSMDSAIKTLKNGVVDFLIKPIRLDQIEVCLKRVLRERRLFAENIFLKKEVEQKKRFEKINIELTKKVDELTILNKIMTNLTSLDSSSDVFNRVVELTKEITHADESKFYLINETVERPIEVASSSAYRSDESGANYIDTLSGNKDEDEFSAEKQLILETATDGIPLLITECKGTRGLPTKILSFMAVPLKIREKVFGVLTALIKHGQIRLNEKDLYYLSVMTKNTSYAIENLALYENIFENLFSTLYAFVKTVEARDVYTHQHSERVSEISTAIAKKMGRSTEELDIINFAGRLHDIGKIGIRDSILLKPDKLTDDEFEIIKKHPVIGAAIVGQLGLWENEQLIIKHHHESYDGKGYPDGLEKKEIPLLARILAVADTFDAMDSDRAYRKKMKREKIVATIKENAGTQFDPNIVNAFLKLYNEGKLLPGNDEKRTAQAKFEGKNNIYNEITRNIDIS